MQIDDPTSFLHLQADIDRLYFNQSEGGRWFVSVEDLLHRVRSIVFNSWYVESCNDPLLEAVYK